MSIVGKKISHIRRQLGWTQEELAEKMGYKHKSSINKIELGIADITQSKVVQFAEVLGTTPAYLMGWLDEPESREEMILNEKEKIIIEKLRTLPDDKVELVLQMLDFLLQKNIDTPGGNENNET